MSVQIEIFLKYCYGNNFSGDIDSWTRNFLRGSLFDSKKALHMFIYCEKINTQLKLNFCNRNDKYKRNNIMVLNKILEQIID